MVPRLIPMLAAVLSSSLVLRFLLRSYPHNYLAAMRYPHPPHPINLLLFILLALRVVVACLGLFALESSYLGLNLFSMIAWFTLINIMLMFWGNNNNLMIRHRQEAGRGFEAC